MSESLNLIFGSDHSCPALQHLVFALSPGWQVAGMKREGKSWQCMAKLQTSLTDDLERAEHLLHPPGPKLQGWWGGLLLTFMTMGTQNQCDFVLFCFFPWENDNLVRMALGNACVLSLEQPVAVFSSYILKRGFPTLCPSVSKTQQVSGCRAVLFRQKSSKRFRGFGDLCFWAYAARHFYLSVSSNSLFWYLWMWCFHIYRWDSGVCVSQPEVLIQWCSVGTWGKCQAFSFQ